MIRACLISARDGVGVKLGVKVSDGVKVGVMLAVGEGVKVAAEVDVMVGVSLGVTYMVGDGTGGREPPQILGRAPQPERMKVSRTTIRRFRGFSPKDYFNIGIFIPWRFAALIAIS